MDVPEDHYEPSDRSYPIGTGFAGKDIGLEPSNSADEMTVQFRQFDVDTLNLEEDQLDY